MNSILYIWSWEKTPFKFTYPQNCYRFFPNIACVGFGVQNIYIYIYIGKYIKKICRLELRQKDIALKLRQKRFAF